MNDETDHEKIIRALDRILQDKAFLAAPKSSALLQYVVRQTLNGNAHRIKAYSIAVDAIKKPVTFDPQSDPSVRVLALRVRKMLAEYYARTSNNETVLQLNPGSYVPQFIVADGNDSSCADLEKIK